MEDSEEGEVFGMCFIVTGVVNEWSKIETATKLRWIDGEARMRQRMNKAKKGKVEHDVRTAKAASLASNRAVKTGPHSHPFASCKDMYLGFPPAPSLTMETPVEALVPGAASGGSSIASRILCGCIDCRAFSRANFFCLVLMLLPLDDAMVLALLLGLDFRECPSCTVVIRLDGAPDAGLG